MHAKKPVLTLIDRLKLWQLLLSTIFLTFAFATSYYVISSANKSNGIIAIDINGRPEQVDLGDAFYFSIITETTLGYGDIRPVGFSRVLACMQVTMGLILAGLFVAKITSGRDRKIRTAAANSSGYWLEIFNTPKNELAVAFVTMYYDGDTLHYDGTNYNRKGEVIEDFTGTLISIEGNILTYYFSNLNNDIFNNGMSVVNFKSSGIWSKWDHYDAQLFDFVEDGHRTVFYGIRANSDQVAQMLSTSIVAKRTVVEDVIRSCHDELVERKIIDPA